VPALDAGVPLARQLRGLVSRPELGGLARQLRAATPDLVRFNQANVPLGEQTRQFASCQNEVIVPWSNEKVPDKQFPAKATIAEEGARALPGLSGESRSGDSNGQWFRVFVNGGNLTYQLNPGEFFQAASPVLGVNPPPARERPPLRPDVPCETQQRPDLRTIPGPPPTRVQTTLDPARYAKAEAVAVQWLRERVKAEGLANALKVTSTPLAAGQLPALRGTP
jgi:hypothetical protein